LERLKLIEAFDDSSARVRKGDFLLFQTFASGSLFVNNFPGANP